MASVADALAELDAYEAWRPALAAFYRAECWFQSAENVGKFNMPLDDSDRRTIDALIAAAEAKQLIVRIPSTQRDAA